MCRAEQVLVDKDGGDLGQDDEAWCLGITGVPRKTGCYQCSLFSRVRHREVDTDRGGDGASVCSLDLQDQREGPVFQRVTVVEKERTRGKKRRTSRT